MDSWRACMHMACSRLSECERPAAQGLPTRPGLLSRQKTARERNRRALAREPVLKGVDVAIANGQQASQPWLRV